LKGKNKKMKKMMKTVVIVMILIAMVTMTACSKDNSGFSLVSVDEDKANSQVVATVDGEEITKGDVIEYIKIAAVLSGVPADYYFSAEMADQIEDIKVQVLDTLANEITMTEKANEFGLDKFTAEENDRIDADVDMFIESIEGSIELQVIDEYQAMELETESKEFDAEVKRRLDDWYGAFAGGKDQLVEFFKTEEIFVRVQDYVVKDIDVSETEVKAFYDSSLKEQEAALKDSPEMVAFYEQMGSILVYKTQDTFYVRHILIAFDEKDQQLVDDTKSKLAVSTTPEEEEAAKAILAPAYKNIEPKVLEVQTKIADGTDFGDLIAEYGEDPGMASNPDGYPVVETLIEGEEEYVQEFEAAAIALTSPGQVSEPVKTMFGVHILELVSIDKAGAIPYENIKDILQQQLLNQEKGKAWDESFALWNDSTERVDYVNRLKD